MNKIIFAIIILINLNLFAQWEHYKSENLPVRIEPQTDKELIREILIEIQNSIFVSSNDYLKYIDGNAKVKKHAIDEIIFEELYYFKLENIEIEIKDGLANVNCEIVFPGKKIINEKMILSKYLNSWKIKSSSFIIDYLSYRYSKFENVNPLIQSPRSSVISELYYSTTALLQREAWGTDIFTINRSVTRDILSLALFSDIADGEVVALENTADKFSVISDNTWNRLIYMSDAGLWMKSYGDNSGDIQLLNPTSVSLDKFGNIFVLSGNPSKISQLIYDSNYGLINFVKDINISGYMTKPVDIAHDCNSTPDIVTDDKIWVADELGNAIYKLNWEGAQVAKYTSFRNNSTGEIISINNPSKIVVPQNPWNNFTIGLIDQNKKRIIFITDIFNIQGEEILCDFFEYTFSQSLDVTLNSLSYFLGRSNESIWVSDERNKCFHILNVKSGYLGSLSYLNNIVQWNKPLNMISTAMSNSYGGYYGLMTIDDWNSINGINTYYEGAELRNIFARYNVPSFCSPINTNIYGTFLTRSKVNIDLHYYKANLINRVMTDFNFDCNKDWPIFQFCNPYLPSEVGMYTAKIFVEPQDNDNYGDWQMTPLEYNFHFALPVSGALNGPSQFSNCSDLTFNVDIQSGSGDFTYSWFIRKGSNHSWVPLSGNSNQLILPVNDGNTTFTLRCDVHDSFNNTEISLSKSVNGITQIGALTSDETWCGNIEIWGDVIVPRDITLSIEPGALLSFKNNASLIIDGSLISNGEYYNKIGFNFISPDYEYQNGIKINQGGTANISYSVIDNAYIGITINETNADINNCEISNCGRGIYLYRTNYANEDSWLMDNKIRDCYWYGISMYQSSPYIIGNELYDNGMALFCDQYSSPYLGYAETYGNNYIHNNSIGLFANFSSNPFLGRTGCIAFGGNNSFVNQTSYHIEALNDCEILAENNWWDSFAGKFYSYNSNIDYEPYLESPPFNNLNNMKNSPEELAFDSKFAQRGFDSKVTTEEKELGFQNDWCIKWKLLYARNLIEVKKYKQAQKICKDVIEEYPDSSLTHYAVDLLWQASRRGDNDSLKGFFKKLSNKKAKKKLYASAEKILAGFERNLRIENLDRIIAKYSGEQILEAVLFDKFIYYFKEQKNKQLARDISNQLDSLFPGTHTALEAHRFLGDEQQGGNMLSKVNLGSENMVVTGADNLPKEYELRGNYPNPFNPSTTISYGIPEESKVQITIYDILGTRVTELVNEIQSAGYYNVTFNARNLASGIYIYRLTAVKPDGKLFDKVSKLMLLK